MNGHSLRPVDELLWSLPHILDAGSSEWAKGFIASILRASKRRGWQPTPKQHRMMDRLVADHYRERSAAPDDDSSLIED